MEFRKKKLNFDYKFVFLSLGDKKKNELKFKSKFSLFKEIQSTKPDEYRGYFSTEELINVFKELSTRPEIYHLLVRYSIKRKSTFETHVSCFLFLLFFFLHERYSHNQDFLSMDDLTLFLEAEQGVNYFVFKRLPDSRCFPF